MAAADGPALASESLTVTVDGAPSRSRSCASATAAGCTSAGPGSDACACSTPPRSPARASRRGRPRRRPRLPAAQPLRRVRRARPDGLGGVLPARGQAAARRGQLLGRHPAVLRQRLQPAHRRRHPDPAGPPGRVPRLRPPGDRDAARPQRRRPAWSRSTPPALARWTSMRSSRPRSTGSGGWSTPPRWPPAARWCGSRPAATPPTPRSSPSSPAAPTWSHAGGRHASPDLPHDDLTSLVSLT